MIDDAKRLASDCRYFAEKALKLPVSDAQARMYERMDEFNRRPCALCRRTRKSPPNKQCVAMRDRRSPIGWRWIPVCAECKQREARG